VPPPLVPVPVTPAPPLVPVPPPVAVPVEPPVEVPVPLPLVEVVEVVLEEERTAAGVTDDVGTVNAGAPAVLVVPDPPPQALTASAITSATAAAVITLSLLKGALIKLGASGAEGLHAPAAHRAVVEVLLRQLVAPIAKAQIVDRPWQLRGGRSEWEQLGDHLQLLAAVPVQIQLSGLGFDDYFSTGGGRPHPVLLARPHCAGMLPAARAATVQGPPSASARRCRGLG
jgi:hypothetical protein